MKFHRKSGKIKYGITGLSIGEFNYDEYSTQIGYWVNNALFFYVRDNYTAVELNRLASSEKVVFSADVVFAYDFEPQNIREQKKIGVNLRNLPYVDLSGEFEWGKWNEAIMESTHLEVVGIPDQYDFSEKVTFPVEMDNFPEKTLKVISESEYMIAMRFHVLLMAARLGKVCIPICYCPKVERLAEQLGISSLKLGVHDYDCLPMIIKKVESSQEKYEAIIKSHVKELEKKAKEMFENISEILTEEIKNGK